MERLCVIVFLIGVASAIPGGWSGIDVDDKDVQDAANFGAAEIDSRSNSLFKSRLLSVVKAERQVVAGMKYRLIVRLGELDCMRREDKDPTACQVNRVQKCNMMVWSQPWLSSKKLLDFGCEAMEADTDDVNRVHRMDRMPEFSLGGHRPIDLSGNHVKLAVEFVMKHLNSKSDDVYHLEFFQVVNGTQQVVAGLMLHLKLELIMSSCKKSSSGLLSKVTECANGLDKSLIECDVEILDQAWHDPRFVLHHQQCRPTGRVLNSVKLNGGDLDVGTPDEFENFKQKYQKVYSNAEEEQKRYQIFKNNMKIARQIQLYELGTAVYGASPYADLTAEEFRKSFLTPRWDLSYDERLKPATIPTVTPPDSFDWREHGAVTPVKNQGYCGSCWAFSVTGNIEGQWAIKKKKLLSLSEQELVDCDKLDDGCNGGFPSNAYHEIQRLGGLETEGEYPYKGEDEKCSFAKQDVRVYINGSVNISKNEDDMKAWVYKNGPVSIGINAFAMQFYLWGISHPWNFFCTSSYIDHGVAIVGYGVKHHIIFGNTPYWIVKNSWGKHWGEKGYYLVYRGSGACGLNQMVSSAIVD